jgi:hypothetical protein
MMGSVPWIISLVLALVVCYDHWDKIKPLIASLKDRIAKK